MNVKTKAGPHMLVTTRVMLVTVLDAGQQLIPSIAEQTTPYASEHLRLVEHLAHWSFPF